MGSIRKDFEIVVAHYNEDLSWLFPCANDATIYSKGNPASGLNLPQPVFLPNIGRESHTYLHHIVVNYDRLAETTMFLQGGIYGNGGQGTTEKTDCSIIDPMKGIFGHGSEIAHTTMSLLEMKKKSLNARPGEVTHFAPSQRSWRMFRHWEGLPWNSGGVYTKWLSTYGSGLSMSALRPCEFWDEYIGESHPAGLLWIAGGGAMFAVDADTIQKHPRNKYEKLLKYFEELDDSNPEEGHFMERFWLGLFSDKYCFESLPKEESALETLWIS